MESISFCVYRRLRLRFIVLMFLVFTSALVSCANPEPSYGRTDSSTMGTSSLVSSLPVIALTHYRLTLQKGQMFQLYARVVGHRRPSWMSSQPRIASVDRWGMIRARRCGKTIITAQVASSRRNCLVTVIPR